MSISKNVRHLDDSSMFRVTPFPVAHLIPHEEYIPTHLIEVRDGVIIDDVWTRPIIVCAFTGVILDGHHRHQLTIQEELKFVPAVLVNYSSPEIVIHNGDKEGTIDYRVVLNSVDRGMLLPKKFTRHVFSGRLENVKSCTCKVPMSARR